MQSSLESQAQSDGQKWAKVGLPALGFSTGRLIPAFHLPWITTTKKKNEHRKDKHLPQKGLQEIKFVGYLPDLKYYEEFR